MTNPLLTATRSWKNVRRHAGKQRRVPTHRAMRAAVCVAVEALESRRLLSAVGLVPTQDAYVRDGSYASTNFGSAPDLQVKQAPSGSGFNRSSYLQFNLSGQSPIQYASLEIHGGQNTTIYEPSIGIAAHAVTSNSWTQSGITFNNAPAVSSATLATASVSGTQGVYYFLNLTSYFQQQQAEGHTTVSLALSGNAVTQSYADFSSTNGTNGANGPLLLLQTGSPTPTPTPTPTTTSFGASEDAYVEDGPYANENFGSATDLQVKQSNAPGYTRISYLTFNLSSISSSATINSATLNLTGKVNGSSPVQVEALQVPGGTFSQSAITYDNAPVTGTEITSEVISGTSSRSYAFNLTNYVQADIAAGESQVTLALAGDSITSLFASFNSTNALGGKPSLVVSHH